MKGFPRRFGSYALAKPLARGGMGALYLAVRADAGAASDVCVIKTVLPHLADKEYLQRFRDEAKVVVQLSHENLVPVFDSGQVGGEIYLGMNYIDGRDLRAVWNRCAKKGVAFPMDVAAFIVRELALGLEYAHSFGDIKLVHRDVSPPNVLVSFEGAVKLTDFGLASSTLKLEKTAPGIIYGKVSYMSPEQARGEPLDGRTDVFAAGIIFWELLTGRQVYPAKPTAPAGGEDAPAGQNVAEELLRRVRRPLIIPPSRRASRVPPELDRIALRALAPKLDDRYPSCAALAADLSVYLKANAPATDSVRVAKFLAELYAEDLEPDRAEREAVLADARELLARPPVAAVERPVSSLTMPVVPLPLPLPLPLPVPPPVARAGAAERGVAAAAEAASRDGGVAERAAGTEGTGKPSTPTRRSGRGTVAGGPVNQTGKRRPRDEVSAAFAGNAPSSSNPAASGTTAIGSLIGGRYRIKRLSGEGGMGRVYEAEHVEIGKRVALKILHPGYSQTPDLVERLRREARAASRIGHPNVVDVTDSGTTEDGSFFFVMEYLEGRELGDLIFEEKGLDIRRAIGIASQICRALQAAHAVGVIHRDLKPENVLIVARDGQKDFVKVLDFGIAKNLTDPEEDTQGDNPRRKLTSPGVAMGTPEYMAPEQAAGRPADARSDIYAVGGILYEMLCGHPAYEGANFMEVLHKKATMAPTPIGKFRNDVPIEIEALIQSTMAKDPAGRPQSMEELDHRLQEIAARCLPTVPAPRMSRLAEIPRPFVSMEAGYDGAAVWDRLLADRRRVAAVAAAFVVVSLAIFGISRAHPRSRTDGAVATSVSATSGASGASTASTVPVGAGAWAAPAAGVAPVRADQPVVAPALLADRAPLAGRSESDGVAGGTSAGRGATLATIGTAKARPAAPAASPVETRKMLDSAEELLRAQRFGEASALFTRLTKNKATRGRALVALAEIAFQEKNYEETIRSAKLATAERGGGARAQVLLGDAHFRLSHYPAAVTAYQQALRIEPGNTSARSGLALASKRM